ncbi:MAG TPA: J domain-containing protein [Terriglobia bacterium]|jgi:curved DNA-binding protein CbpA
MPPIKTFYDELGVPRDANAAAIKHAFKEVAKVYHPDKNPPDKQAWAHEQMSRFNFIMETLLNPTTRQEYDDLVKKYEEAPAPSVRPRRPREQNALEREYAQVSVEIMNLAGKYSNCRLKMMIGAIIGSVAAIMHISAYLMPSDVFQDFPITFAFTYFFTLIGGVMLIIGISDYLGRGQYRRRINELEQRRSQLRERMYEAFVSN